MILAFSVSSVNFWGWPFAASIGGLAVLVGLWMEYSAEKKWYANLDDFRSQKSKEKWGEKLVMLGIVLEVIIGFTVAAKDEIVEIKTTEQMAQTSTNLAKIDPLKQPIVSATAQAFIFFRGNVQDRNVPKIQDILPAVQNMTNVSATEIAEYLKIAHMLFLLETNLNNPDISLVGDEPIRTSGNNSSDFNMVFHESVLFPISASIPYTPLTVGSLGKMNVLIIFDMYIPDKTEVTKGDVLVTVNSSYSRRYTIPPQTVSFPPGRIYAVPDSASIK